MAAAHLLLVEHVVLLPECQFWVPRPSAPPPPGPCLCSGHCSGPVLWVLLLLQPQWRRRAGSAGVSFKPYTSCFHTIFRLLCSTGFKCHRSHYTQISAQRGPITCINKYSNKHCDMRTLFPPDPWFCLVGRSHPCLHVGCITVHSQPKDSAPHVVGTRIFLPR